MVDLAASITHRTSTDQERDGEQFPSVGGSDLCVHAPTLAGRGGQKIWHREKEFIEPHAARWLGRSRWRPFPVWPEPGAPGLSGTGVGLGSPVSTSAVHFLGPGGGIFLRLGGRYILNVPFGKV